MTLTSEQKAELLPLIRDLEAAAWNRSWSRLKRARKALLLATGLQVTGNLTADTGWPPLAKPLPPPPKRPCILDLDSPSYPPVDDEYRQCGCPLCERELERRGIW